MLKTSDSHALLTNTKIILASGSPRRIEMLRTHGIEPLIMPAHIEENLPPIHGMHETVMFLALKKAQDAARAAFGGGGDIASMPVTPFEKSKLEGEGMGVVNFIKELGLVPSNREGFMTIEQGGLKIDGEKITDKKFAVTPELFKDGKILVEKGKKKKVVVELV